MIAQVAAMEDKQKGETMATYMELRTLFGNCDLGNRLEVAIIVAAEAIRVEDDATPNHANRLVWARQAFANTATIRAQMLKALLAGNKALTVAQLTGTSDEAMQTAVDTYVNLFADGS